MAISLVQEPNWTNPLEHLSSHTNVNRELTIKNRNDLVCLKHKVKNGSKFALLIHIIDGFVIEESNVPFKDAEIESEVCDDPKVSTTVSNGNHNITSEEQKENDVINASLNSYPEDKDELMSLLPTKCKYCGGGLPEQRAMWGKRFCSVSCGKKYSVTCSQRVRRALQRRTVGRGGKHRTEEFLRSPAKRGRGRGRGRRSSTPGRITQHSPTLPETPNRSSEFDTSELHFTFPPRFPLGFGLDTHDIENELYDGVEPITNFSFVPIVTWTISQVVEYISSIPGCSSCSRVFEEEEIDGQALLLLKIEHMIHTMNLKLGPALKIAANLRAIKLEYGIQTRSKYLSSPV